MIIFIYQRLRTNIYQVRETLIKLINKNKFCYQRINFYKHLFIQMQPLKEEQIKQQEIDQEAQQSEQQVQGLKSKANLNEKLISSVKKNQYQQVQKCLKKKADINYEQNNKKKWTAFIWGCCMGHYKIVKLLIAKGAANQYLQVKPQNRYVPPGSTKQMKPNPLHWACFKDNFQIFSLLIKAGLHWQDVDSCGNNSVMLAAAGNSVNIFKSFLQYGVDIDCKNSRGHTVKDLTTNVDIVSLCNQYHKAKQCSVSSIAFKQKQIKYWCWVCGKYANQDNYHLQWVLNDLKTAEKQKIDGRCKSCWNSADKIKNQLEQAIEIYEQQRLKKILDKYEKIKDQIEIKFLQKCYTIHHKLKVQNQILNYIKSLSKVDNYKVILKSVNKIHQMLKDAQLIIDSNVIEIAEKQIERLNAQRNLRYQIDNIDTSVATRQGVAKLQQVYSNAESKGVMQDYLSTAGEIKDKMKNSILAQDINQMFLDYPLRPDPYPQPLVIDFKTKRPIDPQTKKPTDAANLLPKKKKGKKAPVFQIPEWANELKQMNDKIKQLQQLIAAKHQLGLSDNFCDEAHKSITLMKRQSRYRKDMDQLQRMVDQATKKKK